MKKPAPATQPLYEAWFECGCTKIAPRRELVEYCPIHGDDREGLVKYTPYEGAQRVKIGYCRELWHYQYAARSKMLDYTVDLEQKISKYRLSSKEKTRFVLMLCGEGFYWHEDELEDFVKFYFTGQHHQDDALGNMEARSLTEKGITLSRSISWFACMKRSPWLIDHEGDIYYHRL